MSKGNACENSLLLLVFNNTAFADVGDSGGLQPSSTPGSLYVSLHTDSVGEAGNQSTNEASYTGYARKAVARSGAGWTVSSNQVSNAAAVTFDPCTGGSSNVSHFAVGVTATSAEVVLYHGALSASLAISNGITPEFAIGELVITED